MNKILIPSAPQGVALFCPRISIGSKKSIANRDSWATKKHCLSTLRYWLLAIILFLTGGGEIWGISKTSLSVTAVGGGKIAITTSTTPPNQNEYLTSGSKGQEHGFLDINITDTYYIWVQPNTGFNIVSMSGDFEDTDSKATGEYYTVSFQGSTGTTKRTVSITFQTTYSFTATAIPNYTTHGSASASVDASIISTNTSEKKVATFTATANSGYEFVGWGATADATTNYESTANPYQATIENKTPGSTANKTLYAIFKPVFNFTATTEKINGSYGMVSATVTPKILGEATETSKSTQATFSATPNAGCTFHGWYYDAAHTQKASDETTYTEEITNNQIGSTASLKLYAWFKANQTIAFNSVPYDKNVVKGTTVAGAAAATTSAGLPVTYSSSNSNVLSVNENGDVTGVAISNDDVTITASQMGNDEYNPISITRDFHVVNKIETSFTLTGLSGTNSTIHVDDQPTITVKNEGEGFAYTSAAPDVVGISKNDNVITLTALKVGVGTVTLTQPETNTHSAVSQTYTITVTKVDNTLELGLETLNAQVDGTITVHTVNQNNTATPVIANITAQSLSSSVCDGTDVISYENGIITAMNAGTARITFTQAETDKYTGFTSTTFEITVTKIPNPITIKLNGGSATTIKLKYQETATLNYSSVNTTSPCNISRINGNYTSLTDGTITAGNEAGTDLYEITQKETYKYEAGYASFSVRVNNTDEAAGYVLYEETEYSHGTGAGVVHTYELSGPGETLYYQARRQNSAIYYNLYVEYSTDGSDWTIAQDNTSLTSNYSDFSCPIPEDARYVRFRFPTGGTLQKYIRNVNVPRKTYIRATSDKTNLGTIYTGNIAQCSFTVDYSTTNGGNIMISSNNPHFVVSTAELNVNTHSNGQHNFTVTYTPDAIGNETANITISDLFYSQQITLTATAAKRDNTLNVIADQTIKVDDEIANVYSEKNSDAALSYSLSKEGVIAYDEISSTVKAIGAGEATLTLTQAENDTHLGTTKRVKFTVSKHDQTIQWDNELSEEERTLAIGASLSANTATSSSGLQVTYSSSNANVIQVDEHTGGLTALAAGSNITITATQAGNYKYNETSITRTFTVISKIDATIITNLLTEETNILTIGEGPTTIGCSATITEDNFTISGNEASFIETSFANNTLTITPVKAGGTVRITLTRAEDNSYNAINQAYTLTVRGPMAVLAPTMEPEIHFPGITYSQITLQRTLQNGHSTIVLPFNTSIQELTANANTDNYVAQLALVTYNVNDGYSLYFKKVENGTINANQPYLIHLNQEIENPVFTDVTASEPQETSIYKDGWTMSGNYMPDKSMDGLYGIAGGKLCKGAAGSTLNAYTAFFTAPASAKSAKVRIAVEETDGTVTWIGRLEADGQLTPMSIYSPDGLRQSKLQRGVNIVRKADGTTQKVWKE